MTPFYRGRIAYVYVPLESGGVVERTTGARDEKIAKKINRMVQDLADTHRWILLRAVTDSPSRLSLKRLYAAFVAEPSLRTLEGELTTPDVVPLIDAFLKDREAMLGKRKSGPRTEYTLAIKRFTGQSCSAARLTTDAINEWLTKQPGNPTYRRNALYRLSSFCKYLVKVRVLKSNPAREVEVPRRQKLAPRYESIATDQAICELAITPMYAALFALIHGTGAEVSPALTMTVRDLNLTGYTFYGLPHWGLCHVPGTKTDKRDRHEVRIEPWATAILRRYVRDRLPAAPLFEGISRYQAWWHHKAACRLVGAASYNLRLARHSWAVRARVTRNETWEDIGRQLGTSPYVVATVYAAFSQPDSWVPTERQEVLS